MKILIDKNLSPDWTAVLEAENIEAVHWSSVLQVRAQDVLPQNIGSVVVTILKKYKEELEQGALIVFYQARERVRILPLEKREK